MPNLTIEIKTQIFSLWLYGYTVQFQLIIIIKSKAEYRLTDQTVNY